MFIQGPSIVAEFNNTYSVIRLHLFGSGFERIRGAKNFIKNPTATMYVFANLFLDSKCFLRIPITLRNI